MSLHLTQSPDPVLVDGDTGRLEQVITNLVTNAISYTPDGGRAVVRLVAEAGDTAAPGYAAIHVEDTGVGIAHEHIPRLTERFYRVDRSRSRETGGTGLGLAIVKHIVNRHRGALTIDSEQGVGSLFTIYLPTARPAIEPGPAETLPRAG